MRGAWIVAVAIACQGHADDPPPPKPGSAMADPIAQQPAPQPRGSATTDAAAVDEPASAPKADDADPPPDPEKTIAELGAVPAWQTVVDRVRYLGRRGQSGVAYGVLDGEVSLAAATDAGPPPESPYVWLVDDSAGNG